MSARPPARPPVRRPAPPEPEESAFARWWARPVNKARIIAPFLLLLFYFFFLRD